MTANPWTTATEWWRNWRAARARIGELDGCGSELARIARDVGVAPSELYTIAAKRPDSADQLKLRLEALHLDAETLRRADPLIMRDLERVCTTCGSKRRCVRDFVRHPDDSAWREYCPNFGVSHPQVGILVPHRDQPKESIMTESPVERGLIVFFRLTIGWTFLYAGIHHFGDWGFVGGFLGKTKTFHDVYAPLTGPAVLPLLTFLVEYGHLLIGLSLISGLLVRVSAPFAIMMMIMYWTAHMAWPYIDNPNNYVIDYHIVYAGVLVYLIVKKAGHVWGLDGWVEKLAFFEHHPKLRPLVA